MRIRNLLNVLMWLVVIAAARRNKRRNQKRNLQINCPQGQYINFSGSECLASCDQNQSFLSTAGNQCLQRCSQKGQFSVQGSSQCVSSCVVGSLISSSLSSCVGQCDQGQLISANGSSCTQRCPFKQFSFGGRCHTTCPTNQQGAALFGDSISGTCVSSCPDRFFQQLSSRTCQECNVNCFNCTGGGQNQCSSCNPGANLNSGECSSTTCQDGSFLQGSICLPCSNTCLRCSSQNFCTGCHQNLAPQQNGVCISCPNNQFLSSLNSCTGKFIKDQFLQYLNLDCPASFSQAENLQPADKAQAIAFCDIKLNEQQVNSQIQGTLKNTISTVTTLPPSATQTEIAKQSRAFIQLSLSLLSKLQDTTEFTQQVEGVSLAAKPIKENEVFALQVAAPTADNPNPSKVELPSSLSTQFKDAKVVAMQSSEPLYGNPPIGNFQPPILTIQISRSSQTQAVSNLADPITLTLFAKLTQPLLGRFYDQSTSSWSSQGLESSERLLPDGVTKEVKITTRHLTSFSLGIDDTPAPPTTSTTISREGLNLLFGLTIALLVILLVIAQVLDCLKKPRYYPHEKQKALKISFKLIYKYSLLYNLPWVNLFSYRDKFIPSLAKALWLSMMYMVLICITVLGYLPTPVNGSIGGTSILLILFLSLLLLPNSIFIWIIRMKNDKPPPIIQIQGGFGSKSNIFTDSKKQPSKETDVPYQQYKQRKLGAILLLVIAILVGILGLITIYFTGEKITNDKNSNRLIGVLTTFIGSVIVGYGYGALKLLIGTHVALKQDKCSNLMKILFLDILTQQVVNYFNSGRPRNRSQKYIEDDDDDDVKLESKKPKKSSKKKKNKKSKKK